MKLKALIGESEKEIELTGKGDDTLLLIDGRSLGFEVSQPEAGTFLFKTAEGVFEAFVSTDENGAYEVAVGSESFEVEIVDPKRLRSSRAGAGAAEGLVEIKSAMPGKIVKIIAATGDEIEVGDGVIVVEAMKMQNELKSPKDGIVKEVRVAVDDRVNSGDVLVVIE